MNHYRKTQRGGGLFSAIEHEQAVAAKTSGILKLRELIPWENFRPLLEELTGYATRDSLLKLAACCPSCQRLSELRLHHHS